VGSIPITRSIYSDDVVKKCN